MPHYPQCCAVSRPCKEYITLTFIFYNIAARRDDCKFFETHNQEIHEAHKHSQQKQFSPGTVQLRDQLGEAEQRAHGAQQGVQQHRHWPGHCDLVHKCLFTLFSESIFMNASRKYLLFHSFTCPSCSVSRPPMVERDSPSSVRWAAMSRGWDAVAVGSMLSEEGELGVQNIIT